jgi:hypothetical protein
MDIYGAPPAGLDGDFYGGHPLGVLAEELASEGLSGPGYLYGCVSLPADAGKRVRGPISRWPAAGLTVYPDGAFDYPAGAPTDYALFPLIVDGQASSTDIGYGPGIGRFNLNFGDGLSGGVQLDDVAVGGDLSGGSPSGLAGGVQLGDVEAAGELSGVTGLIGGVQLGDVVAEGEIVGVPRPVRASLSSSGARPMQRSPSRRNPQ